MKPIVFALTLLIAMSANAQVDIKHPEFTFTLPNDWSEVKGDDSEQWRFESKNKQSSVVLSIMQKLNLPQSRLVDVAKKFASLRKEGEQKARPGQKITYGEEWVELKPSGDVAEIAYAGYDEKGNIFRFFGFVTQAKVLSFWVSTSGGDNNLSKQAFDEAFRGLKFYVP